MIVYDGRNTFRFLTVFSHGCVECKNYKKRDVFRYDSVSKMGLNMVGASVIVPDSSDGTDPENPYADGKWSLIA
jgi:hypothetical protein